MKIILMIIIIFLSQPVLGNDKSHTQNEKKLYFISPTNGETVASPVVVKFGIKGMTIVPAGEDKPMSGHHHLLINVDSLPDMNMPIPANKKHLHFGKGETDTSITLPKGKHTLQLLLGNYMHVPHKPPLLSEKIEITVK